LPRSETPTQLDVAAIALDIIQSISDGEPDDTEQHADGSFHIKPDTVREYIEVGLENALSVAPVSADEPSPPAEKVCEHCDITIGVSGVCQNTYCLAGPCAAESEQPTDDEMFARGYVTVQRYDDSVKHLQERVGYWTDECAVSAEQIASLRSSLEAAQRAFGDMWREDLGLAENIKDLTISLDASEMRADDAVADLEAARKALEPFAKLADEYSPDFLPDNFHIWNGLTLGNLRAAARALENLK
jgi:hypothetical protein